MTFFNNKDIFLYISNMLIAQKVKLIEYLYRVSTYVCSINNKKKRMDKEDRLLRILF